MTRQRTTPNLRRIGTNGRGERRGETKLFLDSAYGSVLPGGYIAIEKPGQDTQILSAEQVMLYTRTAYGVSSKTTHFLSAILVGYMVELAVLGRVLTSDPATVSWGTAESMFLFGARQCTVALNGSMAHVRLESSREC